MKPLELLSNRHGIPADEIKSWCESGKVASKRHCGSWLVDEDSLISIWKVQTRIQLLAENIELREKNELLEAEVIRLRRSLSWWRKKRKR